MIIHDEKTVKDKL